MKNKSTFTIADLRKHEKLEYINHIWLAIMIMQTVLLDFLLDETIDYEDIGKEKFISKLNNRFNYHKSIGDDELEMVLDSCKGCNCNQLIYKFIGNNSGENFALYFDMDKNAIKDIYHCNKYGSDFLDN